MVSAYKKLISRFLCIGTEWFPRKGGLSTFNRQLAITLASCGYEVHCYLPDFTEEEALDAKEKNVSLIKAKQSKGQNDIERLSQKPTDLDFDVIIGHDIVTGPAMADLKMNYYKDSKVILFIHTAPGEIEWLKPEQEIESVAGKAETKENKQKELALNADWVAAVGPHLFFETQSLLSGATSNNNLIQFNPGLFKPIDQINFDFTTLTPEALLVGRIEDYTLKGVDIAVRSMHNVYTKWDIKTNGYLVKPKLIIRGLTVGTDDQLIKKLKEIESSNLRIQPKNYNAQTDVINEDIRKTALVLMPSRAEGFGLIALEALSNGRPILVSESSGFAMLLKKVDAEGANQWIVPNGPDDNIKGWGEKIYNILSDRKAVSERLRTTIEKYSGSVNWEASVKELIEYLTGEKKLHGAPIQQEAGISRTIYLGGGVLRHPDGQYELRGRKFDFFAYRIAQTFPGIRGLSWINNPAEAIKRLNNLLSEPLSFTVFQGKDEDDGGVSSPIWWFRGGASMFIKNYQAISNTKCLIGPDEFEIDKIAVYRDRHGYRDFVYVRTKAEETVDPRYDEAEIERIKEFFGYTSLEYGLYKGKVITREEYDDGATIIDGEPLSFEESPELRIRMLTPYNFIIAAQSSVYNSREGDILFGEFLEDALSRGIDDRLPEFIEKAKNLDTERSYMIDFDYPD